MVANVFLVDATGEQLRIRRWNADTRTFDATEWPAEIEKWRPQFEQERREYDVARSDRRPAPAIRDDALMVFPVRAFDGPRGPAGQGQGQGDQRQAGQPPAVQPRAPFGFTVIQLSLDYIKKEMLPELTQRHFEDSTGDAYRVSVTTAETPPKVIYQSEPDAPIEPARADATESLYGRDPLGFFRGIRGGDDSRLNITVNVIEGQDGTQTSVRPEVQDSGRWRLLVQHQSGSLEAAVGQVRRRNLAISFGVLLLLSVSVGHADAELPPRRTPRASSRWNSSPAYRMNFARRSR